MRGRNTERAIEHRCYLLEDNLEHLHECRDDENEDYGLHEAEAEGGEHPSLKQPCDGCGEDHDECHSGSHAHCARELARHAYEGAYAEKLGKDDVVDKDCRDDDGDIFEHLIGLLECGL